MNKVLPIITNIIINDQIVQKVSHYNYLEYNIAMITQIL